MSYCLKDLVIFQGICQTSTARVTDALCSGSDPAEADLRRSSRVCMENTSIIIAWNSKYESCWADEICVGVTSNGFQPNEYGSPRIYNLY
jgi:hypothetical protein